MGRHKEDRTPEEREEQRRRWWGPMRNRRRQERYHSDPKYAERLRSQRRRQYREERQVEAPDLSASFKHVDTVCSRREIYDQNGKSLGVHLCCTIEETGTALGQSQTAISRWINSSRLPKPAFQIARYAPGKRYARVYTAAELAGVVRALTEHFTHVAVYRTDHEATRDRVFAEVERARERVLAGRNNT